MLERVKYTAKFDTMYGGIYNKTECSEENANLWSSELLDRPGWHAPTLDIDFPALLLPSSSEGKHHLYIDYPMLWKDYVKMLKMLGDVGLCQKKWVQGALVEQGSLLRAPGVYKSSDAAYRAIQRQLEQTGKLFV